MASADPQPGAEWLYVVRAAVDPAVEGEWNSWYDDEHLPEILACPGFVSGSRYASRSPAGTTYLTIYAITGPAALRTPEFAQARGWYGFSGSVEFSADVYRLVHRRAD